MKTLLNYLSLPLNKPKQHLQTLITDPAQVHWGLLAQLLIGSLYTLTVWVGYMRGFGAVVTPFLNIPAEQYYFWETFFCMPVFILISILFAGMVRVLAAGCGGRGTFESIFAIYSISIALPMFLTMWLPESILIFFFPDQRLQALGGFAVLPLWLDVTRQLVGVIWPLIISMIGIRLSEKISWPKTIMISLVAFIITSVMMVIFIR